MDVVNLIRAAARGTVSESLALACAKAESDLNLFAERWGRRTAEAPQLIGARDWAGLQALIDDVWPDVSFGLSQQIVKYHWAGDRTSSVENVLNVRRAVFSNADRDVAEMVRKLADCYAAAGQHDLWRVGGDQELGALLVYNHGHYPATDDPYWADPRPERYRQALIWARQQAMGGNMEVIQIGGMDVFDVRSRFPYVGSRSYDERPLSAITACVQHHTGDSDFDPARTIEDALGRLDNAYRWHTGLISGGHDWPSIGYHFGIDGEGRVYYCNTIGLVSYHARAANAYGIGVVWLQDCSNGAPNDKMVAAAEALWHALERELGHALTLLGHRECPTNATTCPGDHWAATKARMQAEPTAPLGPRPAPIPGFSIVNEQQWHCDLTGADLAYRMLALYQAQNGLFWLGYPRTSGWTVLPESGRLSKVFQRAIVEIKPQYVSAQGQVDPNVPAQELFELRLLGDEHLREKGQLV